MSNNLIELSDHIETIITSLNNDKINTSQLFSLMIQSVEYIDSHYKNLNGLEKKQLLIEALNDITDHSKHIKLNIDQKKIIKEFIENDFDDILENIIQLSKGNFEINKKQKMVLIRCVLKICECVMKQNNNEKRP